MPLDNDYIAPLAIEPAMPFINANFTKTKGLNQRPARLIFRKDARKQFPEALRSRDFHQLSKRHAPRSPPPKIARDINRNLRDPFVALAGTIRRSGSKSDDSPLMLDNDNRMPPVEPSENVLFGPRPRFKRRDPILDPLVVNRR